MWWLTCNDNTCTSGRCTSFKYSWRWALAPETCRVTAEIKPAQCCIKLVFHLTYTVIHGNTTLKFRIYRFLLRFVPAIFETVHMKCIYIWTATWLILNDKTNALRIAEGRNKSVAAMPGNAARHRSGSWPDSDVTGHQYWNTNCCTVYSTTHISRNITVHHCTH